MRKLMSVLFVGAVLLLAGAGCARHTGKSATPEKPKLSAEAQAELAAFRALATKRVKPDEWNAHFSELQAKAAECRAKYPAAAPDLDYYLIYACYAAGKYDEVIKRSDDFLAKWKDNDLAGSVAMRKAYAYYLKHNYLSAAENYKEIASRYPKYASLARFNSGVNYYYAGEYDKAEEILSELAETDGGRNGVNAWQVLGLIAWKRGERDEALDAFWNYFRKASTTFYSTQRRVGEMKKALYELREKASTPDEILRTEAMLALFNARYRDVRTNRWAFDERDKWMQSLGKNLEKFGKAPFAAGPAYAYAKLMTYTGKKPEEILGFIEKWEKIARGREAGDFFALKIMVLSYKGEYEKVLELAENAPESYLDNLDVLTGLANAAMMIDDYDRAKTYLARALALSPNDSYVNRLAKACELVGKPAPEIEGTDLLTGKPIKLSDLRGKVVLVDFWASWCGPCRGEIPNMVRVYKAYKDKGFEIFGVSLDRAGMAEQVKKFCAEHEMTWPQIYEGLYWDVTPRKAYGFSAIPFMVLVDREGIIRMVNKRGARLEPAVKKLLGL